MKKLSDLLCYSSVVQIWLKAYTAAINSLLYICNCVCMWVWWGVCDCSLCVCAWVFQSVCMFVDVWQCGCGLWWTSSSVTQTQSIVFGRPKHTWYDLKTWAAELMGNVSWILFTSGWLRNVDRDSHNESPTNRGHTLPYELWWVSEH